MLAFIAGLISGWLLLLLVSLWGRFAGTAQPTGSRNQKVSLGSLILMFLAPPLTEYLPTPSRGRDSLPSKQSNRQQNEEVCDPIG